jgi:adenylosuccinate synthase
MVNEIKNIDICCGLNWGDEAKGKIISQLSKSGNYSFVCRWAGGNNAGHTIYKNGKKYKSHLIPSGIFYNIPSIIGPGCVVNKNAFQDEIDYLRENGFDTSLIKISPKAHIILEEHINDDKSNNSDNSTSRGIAPCYKDKFARIGKQVKDDIFFTKYIWDEKLFGNVLCEGAQGFWLDIDKGNYPYVTSSTTLPYGACSLGFPPKLIRNIYGATKIYDTRVGYDPLFPDDLLNDNELSEIALVGKEFGTTTGRTRKVNWLNLDLLKESINISGSNIIIISKVDILESLSLFKIINGNKIIDFFSINDMKQYIYNYLIEKCPFITKIIFSSDVEIVDDL